MPQSKEVHRDYMRKRREVHNKGSQGLTEEKGLDGGGSNKGLTSIEADKRKALIMEKLSHAVEVDVKRAAKLLLICRALDKTVTGLDGKKVNLQSQVRYGVYGPTFEDIKISLGMV